MRFIYFTFVFQMDEVMTRKDFEVMAPVGSYESLYAALQGGADSVYFGVEGLNMRARSSANFTLEDLKNIVSVCSEKGVKTYLTVNTVIYNQELEKMRQVIDCAGEAGVTAIIASDLAAILYARSVGVEVHISTQCNVTNFEVVRFFAQYADVIVLAREVVLEQVMEIHRRIVGEDLRGPNGGLIKIEMFAHGALCMAVSVCTKKTLLLTGEPVIRFAGEPIRSKIAKMKSNSILKMNTSCRPKTFAQLVLSIK